MSRPQGSKAKERGSNDEIEILREIIKNDPLLMEKVLEKIRGIRQTSKTGIMDQMANKQVSREERTPQKKGRVP